MIYIEYRIRREGIDLDTFHQIAARRTNTWSERIPRDALILNLARTWRIGPHPEYLVVYHTPGASLERLDEWEQIFRSGEVADLEAQTQATSPIVDAGCYVELMEPLPGTRPYYYAEYFDAAPAATRDEVVELYQRRAKTHSELTLNLVCDRIGHLGPDPQGVAVWSADNMGAFRAVAIDVDRAPTPIEVRKAGLYAEVGKEIL